MIGKPLFYSVGFLLVVGIVIPGFLSNYTDVSLIPSDPYTSGLADMINNSYTVSVLSLSINLNPFSWLGSATQNIMAESALFLSHLPIWLTACIMIIVVLSFVYFIVLIIRGVS